MGTLAMAPGVISAAVTTYVTAPDVKCLLGCMDNKAYETIREINKLAKEKGLCAYGKGKASKYIFAEKYGIPINVIDSIIDQNKEEKV